MSALLFHMIGGAPDPVAPFSHAVEADGWVFVTGQMPFTETSNTSPYPESIEDHTHQVMKNLVTVLEGCDLTLADVAAVRVFLRHFDDDSARRTRSTPAISLSAGDPRAHASALRVSRAARVWRST